MSLARPPRPVRDTDATAAGHASRCMVFTGEKSAHALENPAEISELLKEPDTFVWMDLAEPTAADLELLREEFSLHPTAIEDAALVHERPKVEIYEGYWLFVLHATSLDANGALVVHELALLTGKNFLISIRAHPVFPIEEVERRWLARGTLPHDASGLLYVILDVVVDSYHPVALSYDERLVSLEARVLDEHAKHEAVLREILTFKRDLVVFRHAVAPVRDVVNTLLRGEDRPVSPSVAAYYRDVYDHALRESETIDGLRELVNSTLDIHLSTQAQRQGEVSKQLTIIATIFLPLTYVTGFFGQNFGWMVNNIVSPQVFWGLGVGSEIVAVVILLAYFRRKRWF